MKRRTSDRNKERGFVWRTRAQYPATVTRVDELRVELIINEDAGSLLSSQKHFRGRVEIEVERVTPSSLVLRSIGRD